ncbi:MAG: NgoFVII family restriction endonuclease [Candidatus Aegiribacteria sp.]|nr:NgoFVII family restriction endonuclease [Candidatus Aegiribacteria sp.]
MIHESLFEQVLVKPLEEGLHQLRIISGYATSAMAFHHLEHVKSLDSTLKIELLVGMCPCDGISISNHRGFQDLMANQYLGQFRCSYVFKAPPVHSKLYIWHNGNSVKKAFIGSANYTQNGFSANQREVLAQVGKPNLMDYFEMLESDSVICNHQDAEGLIKVYNDRQYYRNHTVEDGIDPDINQIPNASSVVNVTVSLLSARTGEVQNTAGLNWGQRERRNRNQAYIQLPPDVYRSDFFPLRANHFTVVTDDSKVFICTRAQKSEEGQAIETPHNNSLLGEYFRNRIGLANGAPIRKRDLDNYGRTDVTFYKFDEENYYMDFSV